MTMEEVMAREEAEQITRKKKDEVSFKSLEERGGEN